MIVVNVMDEGTDLEEIRALSLEVQSRMPDDEVRAIKVFFEALFDFDSVDEAVRFAGEELDFEALEIEELEGVEELRVVLEEFDKVREHPSFDFEVFASLTKFSHGLDVSLDEARAARERADKLNMDVTISVPCSCFVGE